MPEGVALRHVEAAEYAQREQRHQAVTVGRQLVYGVAAVVHAYGLHPLGPEGREVLGAQPAARLAGPGVYLPGQLAAVKALAVRQRQGAQSFGVVGQEDRLASPRRAAVRGEAFKPGPEELTVGLDIGI